MQEVAVIARKKGINIGEKEIEMFSGKVIRIGEELGIDMPVNRVLYHGIKVLEEKA